MIMTTSQQKTQPSVWETARRQKSGGFTLVETMIASVIMGLIFFGAMTLFLASVQTSMRTTVQNQANVDGSNGLQYVLGNAREAYTFRLPGEPVDNGVKTGSATPMPSGPAWTPPIAGDLVSNYQCTLSDGTIVNTAVELVFPAMTTASLLRGSATDMVSPLPPVYDRTNMGLGSLLWIYRADKVSLPDGTFTGKPNPANGKCLWAKGQDAYGNAVNMAVSRMVLQTLAGPTTPVVTTDQAGRAVQFSRNIPSNQSPTNPAITEIAVKLVCGDYSPFTGTQTNVASNSTGMTSLSGKCSMVRNAYSSRIAD